MRKSSLILLLVMAFVLSIAASAFCVENEITSPCQICKKKHGGWKYGLEIKMDHCVSNETNQKVCPCPTFDYELGSVYNGGYCDIQDVKGVVFKLCDCEKYNELDVNKCYAVRLTIMAPASGVYWTNQNRQRDDVDCGFVEDCDTCQTENSIFSSKTPADGRIYVSSHPDTGDYCINPCEATATRHALKFYSGTTGQQLYDPADHSDADCCFTCGNNMVKAVVSCYSKIIHAKQPILLIDMPTMVYDPNDINVQIGTEVKVKVEIIEAPNDDDICVGPCKSICECLVKVGEFADCTPQGCDLCAPYMTGLGSGWWCGIAITNANLSATTVKIEFFCDGKNASVVRKVPAQSVDSFLLSSLSDELSDFNPNSPIYAKLHADKSINAFVMVGDFTQSQGYLAPCGDCICGVAAGNCGSSSYDDF